MKVTVEISERWVRLINSPLYYIVSALTGVSVSFFLLFLYRFGEQGVPLRDWRIVAMAASIWLVVWFYSRISLPVILQVRRTSRDASAPTELGQSAAQLSNR